MPTLSESRGVSYGYACGHEGWYHPANRRRFLRFCELKGIPLSSVNPRSLPDVVVVNQAADLTSWSRLSRCGCRIIFDANDGYLIPRPRNLVDVGRGAFKFLLRQHRYLELSYESTYLRMCERADAVVCSHPLQMQVLRARCRNIHLITDFGPSLELKIKKDFAIGSRVHVFWEGLGSSKYMPFEEMEEIFALLPNKNIFNFHFMTDLEFKAIANRLYATTAMNECRKKAPRIYEQSYFYQWNEAMFSEVATKCDFAVIPIPQSDPLATYKPQNKLILMWRMALPTLTAATPSYLDVMSKVSRNLACSTLNEWRQKIHELLNSIDMRRSAGEEGYQHATTSYSDRSLSGKWDNVLLSLGIADA